MINSREIQAVIFDPPSLSASEGQVWMGYL